MQNTNNYDYSYYDRLKEFATEMFQQLGGEQFMLMTGSKNIFYISGKDLEFNGCIVALVISIPLCVFNKHKIQRFEMCLMGDDTYTFRFYKRTVDKPFRVIRGVYCDEVQDTFELETGLLVTMYNRKNSRVVVGENV